WPRGPLSSDVGRAPREVREGSVLVSRTNPIPPAIQCKDAGSRCSLQGRGRSALEGLHHDVALSGPSEQVALSLRHQGVAPEVLELAAALDALDDDDESQPL